MKIEEHLKETKGTISQFRRNIAEYTRIIREKKHYEPLSDKERMEEIKALNKMLADLFEMQKYEVKKQQRTDEDAPVDDEDEEVRIVKDAPKVKPDPESLSNSPIFKDILHEMPVSEVLVPEPEQKKQIVPEVKEFFT